MRVLWARTPAELPSEADAPCVLILPLSGDDFVRRQQRRAWALHIAERCFGFVLGSLKIATTPTGALRFFDANGEAELYLSHASRDGVAAVAVARQPVGVDFEAIGAPFDPAWNILHGSEKTALLALPEEDRHTAFLRLWTAKEACVKLTGQGLYAEPSLLELTGTHLTDHASGRRFELDYFASAEFVAALAMLE